MSKKNLFLTVILLLTLGAVTLDYGLRPVRVLTGVGSRYGTAALQLDKIYDVNFVMDTVPAGNMPCYMPQYQPAEPADIRLYSGLFGMDGESGEDDAAYYFYENRGNASRGQVSQGKLTIYKHINRLHYEKKAPPSAKRTSAAVLDGNDAIETALAFFESKLLYAGYEEAEVRFDGEQYEVMFINRLGNIRNYAFNNRISMDRWGNVLDMDYYYITYEKLGSSEIMSMRDAFWALPADLPASSVNLLGCRLVYFYENSIVQPGYLFEGEILEDGQEPKSFQSFVKAYVY